METQWVDSLPAWTLGQRARNAKFGGNIILAGIPKVSDRLIAIKRLSRKLGLKDGNELRSSGHTLLEIKTDISAYKKHNADTALSFLELKAGIRSGKYPRWVAMTAPQFGFKGAERGGMISWRATDRTMAKDLHTEAIYRSLELEKAGLGAGVDIWWPAFTSRMVDDPTNPPMGFQMAWDLMLEFWVKVLGTTGGNMWLEWKPGDPGIDYLMTVDLAIKFCQAVNNELGRIGMLINNEFAHILLSGITVTQGVQETVDAGLFSKFVHANSGQMLGKPIHTVLGLEKYMDPEHILIGIDWDWALGVGGEETWKDQEEAIGVMDMDGQDVIYCEHDVNPAGLNPLKVFELSIRNRRTMLENARAHRQSLMTP